MRTATQSFMHDGRLIKAGITRVAPDHELYQQFPDRFEDHDGPGLGTEDRDGTEYRMSSGEALIPSSQLDGAVEDRLRRLEALARDERNVEQAQFPTPGAGTRRHATPVERARDEALRTIEYQASTYGQSGQAATEMDALVRRDTVGTESRYLTAVGSDAYESAFSKMVADPHQGHLRFTAEETAAVQEVSAAMAERDMKVGTGSTGGFAVPYQLDPTVQLSSNGVLNPIREVAKVVTVSSNEYRAVTSEGVTANYGEEASEVNDDSPTLVQPNIVPARGTSFVPFSFELGQDWTALRQELLKLITDARDVLDSGKFYSGTGTDEPAGVITGLTTTQRVQTATSATFAVADVYSLLQAVPARFRANTVVAAHPNRFDAIYRFVGGNSAEPAPLPERDGNLLGRPKVEWTNVPTVSTTATKIAIAGDFQAGFTIVDRIGTTAELVQNLFGANRRPSGQRGLLAHWRTSSKVVLPNALRYLEAL